LAINFYIYDFSNIYASEYLSQAPLKLHNFHIKLSKNMLRVLPALSQKLKAESLMF